MLYLMKSSNYLKIGYAKDVLPNGDKIIDLRDKIGYKDKIGRTIKQKSVYMNNYINYLVKQKILVRSSLYPENIYIVYDN